jgi:hypothetical protein
LATVCKAKKIGHCLQVRHKVNCDRIMGRKTRKP